MTEAVLDAGPLIHLAELDALDVLCDFSSLLVPEAVWFEVEHHFPEAIFDGADPNICSPARKGSGSGAGSCVIG